jgi:mRNA interferase MazF
VASPPARGEVWWAQLDAPAQVTGSQDAKGRPALIVSADFVNITAADLVIVTPITIVQRRVRSHVPIEPPERGMSRTSNIQCEQIRAISRQRLVRPLGTVSDDTMTQVDYTLKMVLDLI